MVAVSRPVSATGRAWSATAWLCLSVCILAQIGYPLVSGGTRDTLVIVVVLSGALTMAADLCRRRGVGRTVAICVGVMATGLAFEVVGTATGVPFGSYHYAMGRLGPAVASVPLLICVAWFTGALAVWRVSAVLPLARPTRVVLAMVALVGWDLYLDPQMVADRLWVWDAPGAPTLPGIDDIPLTNYVGWLAMGAVVFTALTFADPGHCDPSEVGAPGGWFVWTWLGSALAHLVFLPGLTWSAPWGFVVMGVLGVPAAVTAVRHRSTPRQRYPS
ncbi:carotenoid biosynthesis protein [Gordonia jinhuaensis]|nr:carotenoid biosynthesis protein [Gordonia jinhuaensis]